MQNCARAACETPDCLVDTGDFGRAGLFGRSETGQRRSGGLPRQAAYRRVIDLDKLAITTPPIIGKKCAPAMGGSSLIPVPSTFWSAARRLHSRQIAPPKWPLIWPWWASSGCIMRASLTPASAMTPPAGPVLAACWKCAATRRLSCWNTGRSSGVWSMKSMSEVPEQLYGATSSRIIRVRA